MDYPKNGQGAPASGESISSTIGSKAVFIPFERMLSEAKAIDKNSLAPMPANYVQHEPEKKYVAEAEKKINETTFFELLSAANKLDYVPTGGGFQFPDLPKIGQKKAGISLVPKSSAASLAPSQPDYYSSQPSGATKTSPAQNYYPQPPGAPKFQPAPQFSQQKKGGFLSGIFSFGKKAGAKKIPAGAAIPAPLPQSYTGASSTSGAMGASSIPSSIPSSLSVPPVPKLPKFGGYESYTKPGATDYASTSEEKEETPVEPQKQKEVSPKNLPPPHSGFEGAAQKFADKIKIEKEKAQKLAPQENLTYKAEDFSPLQSAPSASLPKKQLPEVPFAKIEENASSPSEIPSYPSSKKFPSSLEGFSSPLIAPKPKYGEIISPPPPPGDEEEKEENKIEGIDELEKAADEIEPSPQTIEKKKAIEKLASVSRQRKGIEIKPIETPILSKKGKKGEIEASAKIKKGKIEEEETVAPAKGKKGKKEIIQKAVSKKKAEKEIILPKGMKSNFGSGISPVIAPISTKYSVPESEKEEEETQAAEKIKTPAQAGQKNEEPSFTPPPPSWKQMQAIAKSAKESPKKEEEKKPPPEEISKLNLPKPSVPPVLPISKSQTPTSQTNILPTQIPTPSTTPGANAPPAQIPAPQIKSGAPINISTSKKKSLFSGLTSLFKGKSVDQKAQDKRDNEGGGPKTFLVYTAATGKKLGLPFTQKPAPPPEQKGGDEGEAPPPGNLIRPAEPKISAAQPAQPISPAPKISPAPPGQTVAPESKISIAPPAQIPSSEIPSEKISPTGKTSSPVPNLMPQIPASAKIPSSAKPKISPPYPQESGLVQYPQKEMPEETKTPEKEIPEEIETPKKEAPKEISKKVSRPSQVLDELENAAGELAGSKKKAYKAAPPISKKPSLASKAPQYAEEEIPPAAQKAQYAPPAKKAQPSEPKTSGASPLAQKLGVKVSSSSFQRAQSRKINSLAPETKEEAAEAEESGGKERQEKEAAGQQKEISGEMKGTVPSVVSSVSSAANAVLSKQAPTAQEILSDELIFAFAKEKYKWLYEIHKMGGMSIEEFRVKIKKKMDEEKGSASESGENGQAEPKNPAFSSLNKAIDKKFKK